MAEFRATGPVSKRGKERSSRNAVKHGLNVAITPDNDPLFHELARDLLESGYSHEQAVETARSLLEIRRVMMVYSQTYWGADYRTDYFLKIADKLNQGHYSEFGYEKHSDLMSNQKFFRKAAEWDLKYGSIAGKRAALLRPMMRYQRNAVSRLSKALCRAQ
jgi:hypothetical protein